MTARVPSVTGTGVKGSGKETWPMRAMAAVPARTSPASTRAVRTQLRDRAWSEAAVSDCKEDWFVVMTQP